MVKLVAPASWLTENDVVEEVCAFLESHGYAIESKCTTDSRGVDIIAKRESRVLRIEAKGQTSSRNATENRAASARHGKEFKPSQKFDHLAKAVLTSMMALQANPDDQIAIALPGDDKHRMLVKSVEQLLRKIELGVFWVDPQTRNVSFEGP